MSILILSSFNQSHLYQKQELEMKSLPSPSTNNFDFVSDILDAKLDDYNTLGYFSQINQPSLQATYYALYILNELERLSDINHTKILNYIMSHYNESLAIFTDDYARRYLDMNVSQTFYPYTSLLEVNCYALLSLEILNKLTLINMQESIDFIWSCYQPFTSGFIGQPYNTDLPDYFKLATMDNTFFAISTLDLLMDNWNDFLTEKNELIQFIQDLQSTNTFFWYFGGFENDKDSTIDSLDMFEPNLLSSYYCIKSLDIFGIVDTINLNNYYEYLNGLYNSETHSFQMSHFVFGDYGNIVGTSLGLITSDLTSYTGINRTGVLNFLLNNRNSKGIWNYSTEYLYCELIDTYQIIRALSDSGELQQLTQYDKDKISNAIANFSSYYGFSLLSEDYTSISLLHTIINSFDLYNRTAELDEGFLYSIIENSLRYNPTSDCEGFLGCLIFEDSLRAYRSFPIEYYYLGSSHHYQKSMKSLVSHKHTYHALSSLTTLGKMDNLYGEYNLTELLDSIISSQFLINGYENYGGFLPFLTYSAATPEFQDDIIFIDYAYYAISCMEILSEYLEQGDINSFCLNSTALYTYIHNYIFEDDNYQYFAPGYSMRPDLLMENTFYAASLLKSIESYDLNESKIKNFVLEYINYSNIKTVYYAYKIAELVDEIILLDYDLIYQLIGDIYSEDLKEYFLTPDKDKLSQETILWVAEMVVNDLGNSMTYININHLQSCEFMSIGNNITFTINAKYSGTFWYWIDGILVDSASFAPNGDTFIYSLDDFATTIKDYTVTINATALDGSYGEVISSFSVYSDSSTLINITSLKNCKFLSTGNNITFLIEADYNGTYWYWVDGNLIDTGVFTENGETFMYSLDGFTSEIKNYDVKINATALDGHYGEETATFSVYSDSSTLITIDNLFDYEFMTIENNITFHINSQYPDIYNFSIDNIEISSGTYYDGQVFEFSIDGYNVGTHNVTIWAIGLDGLEGYLYAFFTVFSNSETNIAIYSVDNYIFDTIGNNVNFSISSSYPDSYTVNVDGELIEKGTYINTKPILCSIDGFNVGIHTIEIWANGSDGKESTTSVQFSVFSHSYIEIDILELQNYEFQTIGNIIIFYINASFPDTVKFYIDGILNWTGLYNHSGEYFTLSIDGYNVSEHIVTIWANSTDGSEASIQSSFSVYSLSNTIIQITELLDYEFLSLGNIIKFNINSSYPDYFTLYIDGNLIDSKAYENGNPYNYSIDGYNIGNHSVYIWAIGLDGKIGSALAEFDVYSNSTTILNINSVPNYLYMTTGNYINFSISSKYVGTYNISINGILIENGSYVPDQIILYLIDGYEVGNHFLHIIARSIDTKISVFNTTFGVYTNSSTYIIINELQGCGFLSIGNYLNFSISSSYPDYYRLWIDGTLVKTDNFSNGQPILFSLDNYTNVMGNHTVEIWAISLDDKEASVIAQFNVYSISVTLISIHHLEGFEFLSTGNYLNFSIDSIYPDYFELWIEGNLVLTDNYSNGQTIFNSLDGYNSVLGNYSVFIWAIGLDGKVGTVLVEFSVYSTSVSIIVINELEDFEFLSHGNELRFTIFSDYADYYEIWIEFILVRIETYTSGVSLSLSLDNYTNTLGNHTIIIYAYSLDGKVVSLELTFTVYSLSDISIEIVKITDYEFNSTGNDLQFNISCKYPDFYNIYIDSNLIDYGNFMDGQLISLSIDNYSIGTHNVSIWAIGLDGKETQVFITFRVYLTKDIVTEESNKKQIIASSILIALLLGGPSIVLIGSSYYIRKSKTSNFLKKPIEQKGKK